jgi:hypothetical protein
MNSPQELYDPVCSERFFVMLYSQLNNGEKDVTLDFNCLQALSAYSLTRILEIERELVQREGSLSIKGASGTIRSLFEMFQLSNLLK